MRKIYLILLCMAIMHSATSNAQCLGGRYLNEIFPTITTDSILYSTVNNLYLDVYQPVGDTLSHRPLIILAHGGSFISGTRTDDSTVVWLCRNFAKRGYVTVSIDYRLTSLINLVSSAASATDAVIKAISDGKAAIRYFVKDAASANIYKIDTNNIFIGGNSAGAVLYMHVGYLDSMGECTPTIITALTANGGFEGNSGNAGYTTKSKAIINLAGALNQTSFAGPGDKPSVNCQGDLDVTVPYNCGNPLNNAVPVQLCGLGALEPVYTANSIYHMSHVFVGDQHVPWQYNPGTTAYLPKFQTVDSIVTVFLYSLVCTGISGVNELHVNADVSLFPNPATDMVILKSAQVVSDISMFDETGRAVQQINGINKESYEINTTGLSKGMYFIKISFSNENNTPVVRKVMIQ